METFFLMLWVGGSVSLAPCSAQRLADVLERLASRSQRAQKSPAQESPCSADVGACVHTFCAVLHLSQNPAVLFSAAGTWTAAEFNFADLLSFLFYRIF